MPRPPQKQGKIRETNNAGESPKNGHGDPKEELVLFSSSSLNLVS